jgi:hypothetical protein
MFCMSVTFDFSVMLILYCSVNNDKLNLITYFSSMYFYRQGM